MSGKQEILRCNICLETMRDERMLPSCGHMFCLRCLESYVGHSVEVQCPVCRHKCRVPTDGVRSFPKNIYLKQFLDQLCAECEKYPRSEMCHHCDQMMCAQCRDVHMDSLRAELASIASKVEMLNDVKIIKDSKREKKALTDMQKLLEKEITKAAEDLVKLVKSQEKKIKGQVKSCVATEIKQIDGQVRDYQDALASLKQFTRKYDVRSMADDQLVDMKAKWSDHYQAMEQELNENVTGIQKDLTCKIDLNEVDSAIQKNWNLLGQDGSEMNLESHWLSVSSFSSLASQTPKLGLSSIPLKDKPVCVIGAAGVIKGKLKSPFGITVSPTTNNIIVSDTHNHRIQIFEQKGQVIGCFGSEGSGPGQFRHPVGITCITSGDYVVVDTENHRVVIVASDGKFIRTFGKEGSGVNDFSQPWGVAIDTLNQNIHISDCGNNRVQVVNIYGRYIRTVGRVDLKSPTGIAIDKKDDIYVADCNNHRIVVYSKYGLRQRIIGMEGPKQGQLSSPCDVALDMQGNIVVAEWGNNRVQVFSKEGQSIRMFGKKGSAEGDFSEPRSVAVMADNSIVVCDCGNNRIQVF